MGFTGNFIVFVNRPVSWMAVFNAMPTICFGFQVPAPGSPPWEDPQIMDGMVGFLGGRMNQGPLACPLSLGPLKPGGEVASPR